MAIVKYQTMRDKDGNQFAPRTVAKAVYTDETATQTLDEKLRFKGALVKQTNSQSITQLVETPITFDSAEYDTDSFFSVGNPTRLTIPSGVTKVRLHANLRLNISFSTSVRMALDFKKNGLGTDIMGSGRIDTFFVTARCLHISSGVIECVGNDYFEFWYYHTYSSSIVTNGSVNTTFSIEVIE